MIPFQDSENRPLGLSNRLSPRSPSDSPMDVVKSPLSAEAAPGRSLPTPIQNIRSSSGARRNLAASLEFPEGPTASPPKYSSSPLRRTQSMADLTRAKLPESEPLSIPSDDGGFPSLGRLASSSRRGSASLFFTTPSPSSLKRKFDSMSIDSPDSESSSTSSPFHLFSPFPGQKSSLALSERGQTFHTHRENGHEEPQAAQERILPTIQNDKNPECPSVSFQTLCRLMDREFEHLIDAFYIIDCRFDFEYEGGLHLGHIRGALHMKNLDEIVQHFLVQHPPRRDSTVALVFHCEFSTNRGPEALRAFRKEDVSANWMNHSQGRYPEVYLLYNGYREFFKHYPDYCDPQQYIAMLDPRFQKQCQRNLKIKRRQELRRSSSFSGFSKQLLSPTDDTNTENSNSSNPSSSRSTVEFDLEDDNAFRTQHNLLRSSSNNLLFASDFSSRVKSRSTGNLSILMNENAMPFPDEDDEGVPLSPPPMHRSLGIGGESSLLFTARSADWAGSLSSANAPSSSTSLFGSDSTRHVRARPADLRRTTLSAGSRPASLDKDGKVIKRSVTELNLSFNH